MYPLFDVAISGTRACSQFPRRRHSTSPLSDAFYHSRCILMEVVRLPPVSALQMERFQEEKKLLSAHLLRPPRH